MRYVAGQRRALWAPGLLIVLLACSPTDPRVTSAHVVVEEVGIELTEWGSLRGPVTLRVTNTGEAALEWPIQPPVVQRRDPDGDWQTVWHGIGILIFPTYVLYPQQTATERFAVSSSGGVGEAEWSEPYAGEYRVGILIDLDLEDDGTLALVYSDPFQFHPS